MVLGEHPPAKRQRRGAASVSDGDARRYSGRRVQSLRLGLELGEHEGEEEAVVVDSRARTKAPSHPASSPPAKLEQPDVKEPPGNMVKEEDARGNGAQAGPASHGPYVQRELYFLGQEELGTFRFEYLQNDGQKQHNIWLIALKNIFSKQLPNMPREYITRLVFDRRHRSVAIVKQDGLVVGGITYRPFHSQAFGEIAFCAVSANEQVKGFGSRLMSYTKQFAKERDSLSYFLTYADNNAVTFFAKQGFTTEVTYSKEQWHGYIKDYDGGTLMESVLHKELPYTCMSHIITAQKEALEQRMRSLSNAHTLYPGLQFPEGHPPLTPDQIPGVLEAGWTPEPADAPKVRLRLDGLEREADLDSLREFGQRCTAALRAHEDSAAFIVPVNAEEVPDYYDVIKDPIYICKIEARLASGRYYTTLDIFQADVCRIFRNAQIYNAAETYWYKAAGRLQTFFEQYLAANVVQA